MQVQILERSRGPRARSDNHEIGIKDAAVVALDSNRSTVCIPHQLRNSLSRQHRNAFVPDLSKEDLDALSRSRPTTVAVEIALRAFERPGFRSGRKDGTDSGGILEVLNTRAKSAVIHVGLVGIRASDCLRVLDEKDTGSTKVRDEFSILVTER